MGNYSPDSTPHEDVQVLDLLSLAPQYDEEEHAIYLEALKSAVASDNVYNVALTGAYGTGKSSILSQFMKENKSRVVPLSLSTVSPVVNGDLDKSSARVEELADSRTNLIQKEIVKQLLYRLSPARVPKSRFRRAHVIDQYYSWGAAFGIGAILYAVLIAIGAVPKVVTLLITGVPQQVVAFVAFLLVFVCLARLCLYLLGERIDVKASVGTGGATVTLAAQDHTYFDEYLDEIVYFFEASRCDIVILEDIDRFEDVQIFDTLRALNSLLNQSAQLGRRIVFVYAIRDSVFDEIGAREEINRDSDTDGEPVDRAKQTLKRASRTKFFDVIVPVVPFLTPDNARDVMTDVMHSATYDLDPSLIRLAARHIADMRLLRNIRNEFDIYRNVLVVPDGRMPGISDSKVLAVVLFKNTHLSDFELIRHRESSLDHLYAEWRSLVQRQIVSRSLEIARLRSDLEMTRRHKARAENLGKRFQAYVESLLRAAQATTAGAGMTLAGPATADNYKSAEVWRAVANGSPQLVRLTGIEPYGSEITLSFSAKDLTELLGTDFDTKSWQNSESAKIEDAISMLQNDIAFLRHHTWSELNDRPEYVVSRHELVNRDLVSLRNEESLSFADIVDACLKSELARQLVRKGHLTSHFALFASKFYGTNVSREALEYIRRCVEPGIPDAVYFLSPEQVMQVLREQGADAEDNAEIFEDPSIYNVSILDFLLDKRLPAARIVAQGIATAGALEREFLDIYTATGQLPEILIGILAPIWPDVFEYVIRSEAVSESQRLANIDQALLHAGDLEYTLSADTRQALSDLQADLSAVTSPIDERSARRHYSILNNAEVEIKDLASLNDHARSEAIDRCMFGITYSNLRSIQPEGIISLSGLHANLKVYEYLLRHLHQYLSVMAGHPRDVASVVDSASFVVVLNAAVRLGPLESVIELIRATKRLMSIDQLEVVDSNVWPTLIREGRTEASIENLFAYIDIFGVDAGLLALVRARKVVVGESDASVQMKVEVSYAILNAEQSDLSNAALVRFVASIAPGILDLTRIRPRSGDLLSRLVRKELLSDTVELFDPKYMPDWETLSTTVAASKNFSSFAAPELVAPMYLGLLIRDRQISMKTKLVVINDIGNYLEGGKDGDAQNVAAALLDTHWRLNYRTLLALWSKGAMVHQLVQLMEAKQDKLPLEDLMKLLGQFGGRYAQVAAGGSGWPTFDADAAHEYIFNRLVGRTVRSVERKTFKRAGERLVVRLKQAT
jgi:hypothetical protein